MLFTKFFNCKKITLTLFIGLALLNPVFADDKMDEIDITRAYLSCIKDKNSPYYHKTKEKLEKLIIKNKINYSDSARLADVYRMIDTQKYNSAIYELNELINKGYETSKCNELLGDISELCEKPAKKIAHYYKLALQYDTNNVQAAIKLSNVYFREKKNIMGAEYLKHAIEKSHDSLILEEIEKIIRTKITPTSRYEANILYEALGQVYEKLNFKEKAYEAYSKAIQINPNDIYLKYHLADILYQNNENQQAIDLYNSILNDNPLDFQIKASVAKTLAKDGNLLSSLKEYQSILKRFPNSNQARYGVFKLFEGKLTPDKILEKIYFDVPNYKADSQEIILFAKFLNNMEDYEAAQNFETYALNLKEIEAQKALERKLENQKITENQEIKQKIEPKKEEIKQKPVEKKIVKKETIKKQKQEIKKQETKKQDKKPAKKAEAKQKQLPTTTKKEEIKQKQSTIATKKEEELKKQEEARKLQQEKLEQTAIEKERQKAIAKDAKKYNELNAIAQKYLSIKPQTASSLIAAANTYKQMGEPTSAIKYYSQAKKLDPTNSDIYYNIGLAYLETNNPREAKINLTKSINLDTENTKAKNLLGFVNQKIITEILNKAYTKYEKKEYVPAFEILDEGIKEFPKQAQMYYYRALIYDAMNRNAASIIDLQKAIELDPTHYMAYYELGKIYEKINDERSALVAYERFLSIEPDEKDLINEVQKKVITLGDKYY